MLPVNGILIGMHMPILSMTVVQQWHEQLDVSIMDAHSITSLIVPHPVLLDRMDYSSFFYYATLICIFNWMTSNLLLANRHTLACWLFSFVFISGLQYTNQR